MKRLIVWASPLLGVILGMAGIVIFRQQLPAEARVPEPVLEIQQTRPDSTMLSLPAVELPDDDRPNAIARKQ